ncbi:hypothetical protein MMC22_007109 [Lobaria immixta]|nr:hypothetical protein [Lobaria immixta]
MAGDPASRLSVGPQLQNDIAWTRAKATYAKQRKKPKETDLIEIIGSDGPHDLASFIERIRNEKGAYEKTVGVTNKCLGFLKEHEGPIDLLAQAGGSPGCLAWGLIKWALQMVRGYTEEYEKLIEALANICEWLQPIKLDAVTFANTNNVQECIVRIYGLILTFWEKGILAYTPIQKKRHRLLHLAKATWVDFDKELFSLKDAFANQLKIFEANVRAVHHQETKEGQLAMLSDDLEAQLEKRHRGTCQWIFDNLDFLNWKEGSSTEYHPALYIASGPGGGKSVLTATVVNDLQRSQPGNQIPVFYFFFVNTDRNKNSSIAAARSLLYQVYNYGRSSRASGFDELEMSLEADARENLKSSERIWTLLKIYLERVSRAYVVIDALDECVDTPALFHALSKHSLQKSAGLFVSGRTNVAEQCEKLRELRRVDIGVVEASKDIELFLQTRREGAFKGLLRQKTIDAVLAKAKGMFLWVSLVAQALESLNYATEVDDAITSLPGDLYAAYDTTLARMAASMRNQPGKQKLCRDALQWLACSERAMSVLELFTALSAGSQPEDILFTKKDVISACGPLAVIQQDTIQLVHFSTKEYLTGDHLAKSAELLHFHVDPDQTNVTIARACTEYMRSAKVEKLFPVERNSDENRLIRSGIDTSCLAPESLSVPRTSFRQARDERKYVLRIKDAWRDNVKTELPFAEYAVLYWLPHLQASTYGMDAQNEDSSISTFLESHSTLVWIELYFTINCQLSDLEKLSLVVRDCFQSLEVAWRHAVLAVLGEFGLALVRNPNEARHLDPTILAQYDAELLKWQNASEACYEKHIILRVDSSELRPMPSMMTDPDLRRCLDTFPGFKFESSLGFLHFHRRSKSLLFADKEVQPGACAWLYCQNTESGYKSKPLVVSNPSTTQLRLASTGICKDSKYLCLYYGNGPDDTSSMIVLRIDLHDDPTISNWATLLFTIDCNWYGWKASLHVTSEFLYVAGHTYRLKDGECVQDIEHAHDVRSESNTVGRIFHYADGAKLFQTYAPITGDAEDTMVISRESSFYNYLGRRVTLSPGSTIIGLSNEGRYVLVEYINLSTSARLQQPDVVIFDTFLNQDCHLVKLSASYHYEKHAFYGGDEWLFVGASSPSGPRSWIVTRYHLPSLFSGSNLGLSIRLPGLRRSVSFCISDVEKEAYVVHQRTWYRLDLYSLEWKDELPPRKIIPPKHDAVSADGRRLAIIDQTDRRIQIFDLRSGLLIREYQSGLLLLPAERGKLLASPDLRIWRIGKPWPDNLFHLDDDSSPSTIKAFHIPESVYDLGKDEIHGDCFSTCGKYFGFWCQNTSTRRTSDSETSMKVEITILELDLVHSNVKVHSRISITPPSRVSVTIKFHPKSSMLAIVFGMVELYLHDLQTLKTDLAWTAQWTPKSIDNAWFENARRVESDLEFGEYGIYVHPSSSTVRLGGPPDLMVSSFLDQITFTDKRRAMPSLPLRGPVFDFPYDSFSTRSYAKYYDSYGFTISVGTVTQGSSIEFAVHRYRVADDNSSALPSLFNNPEAPTTQTNIIRRDPRRDARYHLTVVSSDAYAKGLHNMYLLLGDTARSELRLLFVFRDNRPPELKFLDFSWHDMILDIDDFYAKWDANSINDPDTFDIGEMVPRQYNRKSEELSVPLRSEHSHPQRDTTEGALSQG